MVTREIDDTLQCTVANIMYRGPATTLFLYAGVQQGGVIRFDAPAQSFSVPLKSTIQNVNINRSFNLSPHSGAEAPAVGDAHGVVIASSGPDILGTELFRVDIPGAYNLIALPSTDFTPNDLAEFVRIVGSQVLGDLAWRRKATPSQEFLDITLDGPTFDSYLPIDTNGIALDVDSAGRTRAANLNLTPNAQHWWRVSNLVGGQWYISSVRTFTTPNVETGGGSPQVTGITATFS